MMRKLYLLTVLIAIAIIVPCQATIINVPGDYSTIQAGINAGSEGDTVLVQPGTYVENIDFNGHSIVLGSLFLTTGDTLYIPSTIIDGNSVNSVVKFINGENNSAMITGLTIQNGASYIGSGILCTYSEPMISYNIIRDNNAAADGGGIMLRNSNSIIIGNKFINNSAYYWGGGICCEYESSPFINNNFFIGNSITNWGGAIYCASNSYPQIVNNLIIKNFSGNFGGGILCRYASEAIIVNNTISRNHANNQGGGICVQNSNAFILNNILWENTADNAGNEIYVYNGSPLVSCHAFIVV